MSEVYVVMREVEYEGGSLLAVRGTLEAAQETAQADHSAHRDDAARSVEGAKDRPSLRDALAAEAAAPDLTWTGPTACFPDLADPDGSVEEWDSNAPPCNGPSHWWTITRVQVPAHDDREPEEPSAASMRDHASQRDGGPVGDHGSQRDDP